MEFVLQTYSRVNMLVLRAKFSILYFLEFLDEFYEIDTKKRKNVPNMDKLDKKCKIEPVMISNARTNEDRWTQWF